jgi:hypothetical protein
VSADICVFCEASGCLSGIAQHAVDCPFTTGMWPVDDEMIRRNTLCAACEEPFKEGDLCAEVTDMTHPAIWKALKIGEALGQDGMGITFTVCLPCAAVDAEVSR